MNQVRLNQGRKGELEGLNYSWLLKGGKTADVAEHLHLLIFVWRVSHAVE